MARPTILPTDAELRVQRYDRYARFVLLACTTSWMGIVGLAISAGRWIPLERLLWWLVPMVVVEIGYTITPLAYIRARRRDRDTTAHIRSLIAVAGAHGVTWGLCVLILPVGDERQVLLLATMAFAVATGCFSVLFTAHAPAAFFAYQIPHNALLVYALATQEDASARYFAWAGVLLFVVAVSLHHLIHRLVVSEIVSRWAAEETRRQLRIANEELAHRATHDPLTGLVNRSTFDDHLQALLVDPARADRGALMFLDLDDFKDVNDSFGHQTGDALLQELARRIRAAVGPDDVCGRFGGDEFTVLATVRDEAAAMELAEAIRREIQVPLEVDGATLRTSVSVGLAMTHHGEPSIAVMRRADVAVYRAKELGRNRVVAAEEGRFGAPRDGVAGAGNPIPSAP